MTPGTAASLSRIACSMWTTAPSSFTCDSGIDSRSVCTSSGPREARTDVAQRLERSHHQAGSDEQHERQRDLRYDEHVARTMPLAACAGRASAAAQHAAPSCAVAYLKTGIAPKSSPDTSDSTSVNASTGRSIAMSSMRGRLPGASATSSRRAPNARPMPTTPPSRPRTTLSSSSSRASRPVPAPSAARIASSCCRAVGPHEEQVGHVGARDEQDHADGRHQHPQRLLDVADELVLHAIGTPA